VSVCSPNFGNKIVAAWMLEEDKAGGKWAALSRRRWKDRHHAPEIRRDFDCGRGLVPRG